MRPSNSRSFGVVFILSLCLTDCAELAYRQMNDPARDAWQRPKAVIEQLDIKLGSRVADVGAGGGYFTWHLAEAVGPDGTVYAVEIDETALGILSQEIRSRGAENVVPIRAEVHDAKLPEAVDLVFSCDTYHHMVDRIAYFRSLGRSLHPGAQVAILDFHPRGFFFGLLGHGTEQEVVRREMESADIASWQRSNLIDRQHFQLFSRIEP